MGSGRGLADQQGSLCRERCQGPWRRLEGSGWVCRDLLQGRTPACLSCRGLGIPRAALPTPTGSPAPRLRPPSPGPWGCGPRLWRLSGRVCRVGPQAIEGPQGQRAGLTASDGICEQPRWIQAAEDPEENMSNYTNISEPELRSSRLLRGDNPASSPRSLLKRIPLTRHFAKRMKCSKSTRAGASCSKSHQGWQGDGGLVQPPEGPLHGLHGTRGPSPHPCRGDGRLSGPQPCTGAHSLPWLGARRDPRTEQRPGSAPSAQGIDPHQGMWGGRLLPRP